MASRRIEPTNTYAEFLHSEVEQSIPARFEKQVAEYGGRIAVRTPKHELTYEQLNELANRLAHSILKRSSTAPRSVALLMEHDAPLIAAMLAVLKAGRFYVVFDPAHPPDRLSGIVEDSETDLLIADAKHSPSAHKIAPNISIGFDELASGESSTNPELQIAPSALAYLIYTSGSTGKPKGVCQTHRNVLHHTRKYTNGCHLSAQDRFSLLTSCSYGASVSNIFGALLNGGALLPFRLKEEGITALRDWLRQEEITIYHSVPVVFRHLAEVSEETSFPYLRVIKLGGEPITRQDFELYRRMLAENALLYVGLGSTEMNCIRYWFLDRDSDFEGSVVPVGYEVEGTDVLLLDESQREVTGGEIGEIAIRSNYLFVGYWRRPELDKLAFIVDSSGSGVPVFRTRDLGRMLPGGLLQHLGRNEFQIKIRGARVEAAEVELALREQPEITDCAVVARDRGDEKQLVAYLANRRGERLDTSALRTRLAVKLPDYMIPTSFVWLERLPRTNGKIDRTALSSRDDATPLLTYIAPRNQLEANLAHIWQKVLGHERVGVRDNFFELGGHSLAAARVAVAIDQLLGYKLPVSTLFWAPTIEALGRQLTPDESTAPSRSLVELKREGSELPLFIIHGWGGDVHFYGELARLLPGQPVYGLQAVGLDGKAPRHICVEDMAAHYLDEIRAVQPCGPYHFIGFSLGSLIAFEVARRAYECGERVGFLGLLDPPTRPAPWLAYMRTIAPLLAQSARYHLTRWVRSAGRESFHFKRRMKRLRRRIDRNKPRQPAVLAPPGCSSTPPTISGFKDYYSAVSFAYQLRYYPGAIDLVVGDSVPAALLPLWNHLAKGGARYHRISCTHKEMIQREFLPTLAATLQSALANARSKPIASG